MTAPTSKSPTSKSIEQSPAWAALAAHHRDMRAKRLRELFAADPGRATRFSLRVEGLLLDYSKNRITDETMRLLHDLARTADVPARIAGLFRGDIVNNSENRPALHMALRQTAGSVLVNGSDVIPAVREVRQRIGTLVRAVRDGSRRGHTGQRFTDVLHIGIGGSDLGPRMVAEALRPAEPGPLLIHFVSGLDDAQFRDAVSGVDPATTLVVIASKSFTTLETAANADLARAWLKGALATDQAVAQHVIAVTANVKAAKHAGLADEQIFPMWDWVGGRYSLWSAVGLPAALALGMDEFDALLSGAAAMDKHVQTAPLEQNLAVILALLGVWYANFFNAESHVVLPYDWPLRLLPDWLQQLDMESNGKSVSRDGRPLPYTSAPIIWGGPGNDGQHAFYQLLHQGTRLVPADFIVAAQGQGSAKHRDLLVANCLAQAEALMKGRDAEEAIAELRAAGASDAAIQALLPHKLVPGNRPTNTILMDRLDARTLGALLALYEHKVFVQGAIWNINSFDQFGVELGKTLADRIAPELRPDAPMGEHDASTAALIAAYRAKRTL